MIKKKKDHLSLQLADEEHTSTQSDIANRFKIS